MQTACGWQMAGTQQALILSTSVFFVRQTGGTISPLKTESANVKIEQIEEVTPKKKKQQPLYTPVNDISDFRILGFCSRVCSSGYVLIRLGFLHPHVRRRSYPVTLIF